MAPLAPFTASHVQLGLHRVTMGLRQQAASLQKIKVDFSKVPDWTRRATRLSIALLLFGILGHCLHFSPAHQAFASNFRQSCNWAAITCIVVTAPLIGKVAQVAFDRLLGTSVGGFIGCVCFTLGFHWFGAVGGGVFISLMSAVMVWATTYLAFKHSMDQLVRFVQLTYCIVAFGAKPDKGALMLALLRVGGIFAGGLLSVVLAVVVLPRSASIDCLLEMKRALKALYDLNQEVWALSGVTSPIGAKRPSRKPHRHGYSALQLRLDAAARAPAGPQSSLSGDAAASLAAAAPPDLRGDSQANSFPSWPDGLRRGLHDTGATSRSHLDLLVQHDEERESRQAVIEKLFTAVYTALGRVEEHLGQTKGEIYIWHFWGRYFFLPGVHWFPLRGRWSVPRKDLEDMATCIRRVARMLWTLLLDFEEGFGAEMESVLQRYYPQQLLSELATYQARAILDLLRSFPGATTIEVDNLFTLGQVTDCLLQISDARARNMVFKVKRMRAAAAGEPSPLLNSHRLSAAGATPGAPAVPAPPATGSPPASSHGTPPQWAADAGRAAAGLRALELSMSRPPSVVEGSGAAAALHSAPDLEKQPLLPANAPSSSSFAAEAAVAATAAASSPSCPATAGAAAPSTTTATVGSGGQSVSRMQTPSVAASGNGSCIGFAGSVPGIGMFISRLLSGNPGEAMSLHLPPRRYLQELQQQQPQHDVVKQEDGVAQAQQPGPGATALPVAAAVAAAAEVRWQQSEDIFGGVQFDAVASDGGVAHGAVGQDSGTSPPAPAPTAAATARAVAAASTATGGVSDVAMQSPAAAVLTPLLPGPCDGPGGSFTGALAAAAAARPASDHRHATPFGSSINLPGWQDLYNSRPSTSGNLGELSALYGTTATKSAAAAATSPQPGPGLDPHAAAAAAVLPAAKPTFSPPAPAAAVSQPPPSSPPLSPPAPPSSPPKPPSPAGSDPAAAPVSATAALTRRGIPTLYDAVSSSGGGNGFAGPGHLGVPGGGHLDLPQAHDLSGRQHQHTLLPEFARLSGMMSSVPVEPVTFPPTEEGYLSQVRWYSFQFVMDEMVNELEEAFHACSCVLQKLPYPIGN